MTDPASQEVAVVSPQRELMQRVRGDQFKQEIAAALGGGNVTEAKFVRATLTALMQNPELAETEPDSFFASVIKCATDGLLPDGREAALVIFNAKVKGQGSAPDSWVKKAQYMPMIGGFRKIAADHGWAIRTDVVYEKDEFEYELGLEPKLVHRPAPLRTDRGQLVYAYAIGSHRDGRKDIEVMGREEIEKLKAVSKSAAHGPWNDWPERMWEKSVGRRLFAKLPLDRREDSRIEQLLDASRENAADLLYGPDGHAHPVTPAIGQGDAPTDAAPEEGGATTAQAPGEGTGGQQADDTATPPAVSSAPGSDPEPVAQAAEQISFPIPDAVIDEAAAAVVPKVRNVDGEILAAAGKTLTEVAASPEGALWIPWSLRQRDGYWPAEFRASLEMFVQHRAPDVWEQFVAEREQAA